MDAFFETAVEAALRGHLFFCRSMQEANER